jgi:hypothetical protein
MPMCIEEKIQKEKLHLNTNKLELMVGRLKVKMNKNQDTIPKLPNKYEKACIYEIVCKDVNITQRYVGSTTNLIKRRYQHKSACNDEKCKQYNQYVYQFIRANGEWENWDIVLIEQVIDCKDKEHLHKRERHYIESLKAELNKRIPLRTLKEYREKNKIV